MRLFILLVALATQAAPQASPHAVRPASKAEIARYAEQLLIDDYATNGPGAAVIVARGNEILFRGARGVSDVARATPLSAEDQFKIGSITKQFAAAGLLKLVEAGKVSLDDPLSKFIKDYPNGDRITVLELLNHTSGVRSYTDIQGMNDPLPESTTTAQLIDSFKHAKPEFAPGTSWAYDNSGYVLVGAVIEAASGMSWHAYLQETLLQPLGLTHTGYAADPAVAVRQVHGYALSDNGKSVPAVGTFAVHADGALVSNVDDLLSWNRALHKGRVLTSDSYRKMITPVGKAALEQYGFGLWHTTLRNHEMIGHSGHISGFSAYLLYLPESDISVVILQNMNRAAGVTDPGENARRLAAFAIGEPYRTPTPIAVKPATLQQAQGVYGVDPPGPQEFSIQGARVLRVIDGKLTFAHTGTKRSELIPIATDVFQSTENFDRLRLVRDARGAVTGIRFFQEGEGEGRLLPRVATLPSSIVLSRAALERVAGNYLGDGVKLGLVIDGKRLKAELPGQPAFYLIAESPNKFFLAEGDVTVEFAPAGGKPQTAIVHQGAETVVFKRTH